VDDLDTFLTSDKVCTCYPWEGNHAVDCPCVFKISLSAEDFAAFTAALDNPPEPSDKLVEAAREHQRLILPE
jgi:hypothetical protein